MTLTLFLKPPVPFWSSASVSFVEDHAPRLVAELVPIGVPIDPDRAHLLDVDTSIFVIVVVDITVGIPPP